MKGDFSRSTFDPRKHYTSVRMQQGRVQLDADWNEQADILLHLIRTQLNDLLGAGATPAAQVGFAISPVDPTDEVDDTPPADQPGGANADGLTPPEFWIGAGRYYIGGHLVENEMPLRFSEQPDYPAAASLVREPVSYKRYLVYLDVWQRHITAVEDPAIREVALGGPDTTTRLKTVWQVKLLPLPGDRGSLGDGDLRSLAEWTAFVQQANQKCRLMARRDPKETALENCLYRIEIHKVGGGQATFKWSRENGSVVFPVTMIDVSHTLETLQVTVEGLDRDPYLLQVGSWVELVDDVTLLNGHPLPLCRVTNLDHAGGCLILQAEREALDEIRVGIGERKLQHPLLRRWENDGQAIVPPGDQGQRWLDIEKGIQIAFSDTGSCQAGDYWLIPSRAGLKTGLEWPQEGDQPLDQAPHGVWHSFAPLALLQFQAGSWSFSPAQSGAFQTLPQITANLSAVEGLLQNVSGSQVNIQETLGALIGMTHAFSSLGEMQEAVDTLVRHTHIFETVYSEDELEPGDVVALDYDVLAGIDTAEPYGELPVKLASSTDRGLVVGVVWESLKEVDGRLYRVVQQGRAHCKVLGPVEPGDLLVASDKPGYARKAGWFKRPGTLLGKALSNTTYEPVAVEESEEVTQTVEYGLGQQPGAVDALVSVDPSEGKRLPGWVVPGILAVLAVLAPFIFLLFQPKGIEVPGVLGLSEAEARVIFKVSGLDSVPAGEGISGEKPGGVTGTTPQAGERLGRQTPVIYILAVDPTPTETPTPTFTQTPTPTASPTPAIVFELNNADTVTVEGAVVKWDFSLPWVGALGELKGVGYSLPCPPGYVGTGFTGSFDTAAGILLQIGLQCRSLNSAGTTGALFLTDLVGRTGGDAFVLRCGADQLLTGIKGRTGTAVDQVQGVCSDAWGSETGETLPAGGGGGGTTFVSHCPPGYVITEIKGEKFGNINILNLMLPVEYINRINLECTNYILGAPTPTPVFTPTPTHQP
jgi:hypothetical protein